MLQHKKKTRVILHLYLPMMVTFLYSQGGHCQDARLYPCDMRLKPRRWKQLKSTILT